MVYVMLADGFEEIEALSVVDVLRRANIDVCTVSISDSKTVTVHTKISVVSDILISDADLNNADMVVLPAVCQERRISTIMIYCRKGFHLE